MITKMATALAKLDSGTYGPKSYGYGPGVHTSTYPLKQAGALGVSEGVQEGGPGSGRLPEGQEPEGKKPNVIAHWDYNGDRYKAGPRIPKDEMPKSVPMSRDKSYRKEAASGSAFAGVLRSKTQESNLKRAKATRNSRITLKSQTHLREAVQNASNSSKFKVILIQEGLGNLRDCFYYTKEALQGATELFEGKKGFVDHPSSLEEEIRPERSTRDIFGYYENVRYEEDSGRGRLVADLALVSDPNLSWAKQLLTTAVDFAQKFPDDEFVGLSINASGEASEVPIKDFLEKAEIPESVLPKLLKAQEEGIQSIRVVSSLKDAVSVDLVTEAGAGGKILQMLEMEKKPMKQKQGSEKKESKEKDKHESKHESKESIEKDAMEGNEEATPDHEDEEQDKQLFAQMIKQYLGDDHAEDQEAQSMAQHAYEACQADGMSHEMAYETAGKHLAMAKKVGKKMAQKAAESHEKDEMESDHEAHESEEHESKECGESEEAEEKKKESKEKHHESSAKALCKECIKTKAENAKLKESLRKHDLKSYLDKKMSESKKSNQVTKKFREALGAPKSKEHIDSAWKLFMAAYDTAETDLDDSEGFVFTEKNASFTESDSGAEGSFEDCVS
jgi:hypothetical protein